MTSRVVGADKAIEVAIKAAEDVQNELAKSYGKQWQKEHGPTIASIKDGMLFLHREWHELLNRVRRRYEVPFIIEAMQELAGTAIKISADLARLMSEGELNRSDVKIVSLDDALDEDELDI